MKKYLLGFFAIAIAVGFSAFALPHHSVSNNKKSVNVFYVYIGTTQSASDRSKTVNYQYLGTTPNCPGPTNECAVEVTVPSTPAVGALLSAQPAGSVTFDLTTGFPNNGSEFASNKLKP